MVTVERAGYLFWFSICFFAFVFLGGVQAAYGPLLPVYEARNSMSIGLLGWLVSLHAIGAIVSIWLAGRLTKYLSAKYVLLLFSVPFLVGLICMALVEAPIALLMAAMMIGFGFGGFDVGLQLLVMRFFEKNSASAMNLLAAGFGVGAFVSPMAIAFSDDNGSMLYVGLAIMMLCLIACFAFIGEYPLPENLAPIERQQPRSTSWPYLVLFLVYGFLETGLATWAAMHMAPAVGTKHAAAVISSFWLFFLLGRFLFCIVARYIDTKLLLLILSGAAIIASIATQWPSWGFLSFPILGLSLGPIFPTGIAWISEKFKSQSKRIIPQALLLYNSAGLFVSPVISVAVITFGLQLIPLINLFLALASFSIISLVARHSSNREESILATSYIRS